MSVVPSSQHASLHLQPPVHDGGTSVQPCPTPDLGSNLVSMRTAEEWSTEIEVTVEALGARHLAKDDDPGSSCSDDDETDELQKDTPTPPECRVTFRPRVRITSGLNRLRNSIYRSDDTVQVHSASSSRSCSPSSSISAPLRFHSEEPVTRPRWGTLGQRVSLLARRGEHKRRFRERMKQHERMLKNFQGGPSHSRLIRDETSPLLVVPRNSYTQQYICQCGMVGCEYDERHISQEIDTIFGSWPRRLLNPKWWWWHIQPIVYCRCLDEPDDGY